MKKGNKVKPLVEEIATKKNKDIIINLPKNKDEEDNNSTNSAEFSGSVLKENQDPSIINQITYQLKNIPKNEMKKYQEKLKEKTMRMEVDKRYTETERLKHKYLERNSNVHTFDNNPQYQKMLKKVSAQLFCVFIGGIIYLIYNLLIYYSTKKKETSSIIGAFLSILLIAFCVILFIALNFGLLNDPHLSKTFRLFIVIESLMLFTCFIFNIILSFMSIKYLRKKKFENKFIFYLMLILVFLISFIIYKYCKKLLVESVLILLGKKTEYSILMLKEQNLKNNEINFDTNLSVSNNMTDGNLMNSVTTLFNNEDKIKDKEEEEQYKTFNYYNNFHYSVTSARKDNYNPFKKN